VSGNVEEGDFFDRIRVIETQPMGNPADSIMNG
jgi:hypothetical protein